MAYLDNNGLLYLWNKIKSTFVKQVSGKGLSTNDYTTAEKTKLSGIETGANKYVHPTSDGSKHVPATGTSNGGKFLMAGSTAGTLSWGTPPNTTYSVATPSANGLMSSTDKTKLDGIEAGATKVIVEQELVNESNNPLAGHVVQEMLGNVIDGVTALGDSKVDKEDGKGLSTNDYTTAEKTKLSGIAANAEVNQNAFSNVKVGGTTVSADIKTDTLELVAGSNVTLTPDATNDKVTIAAKDTVYTHPAYTAKASGLYKVTVDDKGHVSATTAVSKSDITALGIPGQDTKYTHPTGDGNKHVPATGTTNNGKVLTAGSTAGALSWTAITKASVGLGNVDNTSDLSKPISTKTQEALDEKLNDHDLAIPVEEHIIGGGGGKFFRGPDGFGAHASQQYIGVLTDGIIVKDVMENSIIRYPYFTSDERSKLSSLPSAFTIANTYARKSELVGMYKYKGSVADASKLPTTGQTTGDVYNIEAASAYGGAGMNVAWNGSAWDPLGEIFTITSITNAQIDTICV